MASGTSQLTILVGAGEGAEVVRLPGRLVRRGTDVRREAERLPARDAVALMPDGAWAIDSRGDLFDVRSAATIASCAHRPCVATAVAGHGRVLQVTGEGAARLADGTVAQRSSSGTPGWTVDDATHGVADLGLSDAASCQLFRSGAVRCHAFMDSEPYRRSFTTSVLEVPEPVQVATSPTLGLACVRGRLGDVACGSPDDPRIRPFIG